MRITWITPAAIRTEHGQPTSDAAAARYRILIPAQAINRTGHHVAIAATNDTTDTASQDFLTADIAIFASGFDERSADLAREANKRGAKIVLDIGDNDLTDTATLGHVRVLAELADAVVTNTPYMAQRLETAIDRQAEIIGDPFEGPIGEPRFAPESETLKLLWFGHTGNFDTFVAAIPYFNATSTIRPVEVTALTGPIDGIADTFAIFNAKSNFPVTLRYQPWSVAATWRALQYTDVVVIPSAQTEHHQSKSASRVIESLHAGRFVVAQPVPAYMEFRNYIRLGDDIAAGISWALQHPQESWTHIAQGQRAVIEDYSPDVIARKWIKLFTELRARGARLRDSRRPTTPAVKLNLGCGDKRIPGYINVDIADERLGIKPDVHCDVRKLDRFANDSVDEILSVHVIEYFWRWESLDIMREWARVLKPGGKMIVECPNLLTACIEFVNDPDTGASEGPEGQRTMWVLYGDPRWQDPLMVPRWGYTPQSLAKLMTQAGLINVHQDTAEYKLREPRDMRVVGEKPLISV